MYRHCPLDTGQWAIWKGGGLTSHDRPNRLENYLLLGLLVGQPSQSVLRLVSQSVMQDDCSISVSYPKSSNVESK